MQVYSPLSEIHGAEFDSVENLVNFRRVTELPSNQSPYYFCSQMDEWSLLLPQFSLGYVLPPQEFWLQCNQKQEGWCSEPFALENYKKGIWG